MDNLQKYVSQVRGRLFLIVIDDNLLVFGDYWLMEHVLRLSDIVVIVSLIVCTLLAVTILPWISTRIVTQPTRLIWQAILHIAPDTANVPAPDLKNSNVVGQELVINLISHVYQLASVVEKVERLAANSPKDLHANFVANNMPLPLMILDKAQTVLFANKTMCDYIKRSESDTIGQNVYSVLDMSFASDNTFDKWLTESRANAAVATQTWERVRLRVQSDGTRRQFDLAAYFNRSNPQGYETMLVLFDHEGYTQDDHALNFVALAVHELRTPVTLLRGYIEVLEEETAGKLNPEMTDFMHKMKAAAQSLTAFINNMLDVARIENDQLVLKLHEEKWEDIVQAAVNDLSLRARIQGVTINAKVDPDLPTVGVDRVSIYEVIANLVDNAIKYSAKNSGKNIEIHAYLNGDGMVETTVHDSGPGIPSNLLTNLFEKFYRSHRSRDRVGGTGLGLYLCKALIDAHGGHIWVQSKEDKGSTFGFTVVPYAKLAEEKKNGDNNDITRGAHGWIKNHSLYSR